MGWGGGMGDCSPTQLPHQGHSQKVPWVGGESAQRWCSRMWSKRKCVKWAQGGLVSGCSCRGWQQLFSSLQVFFFWFSLCLGSLQVLRLPLQSKNMRERHIWKYKMNKWFDCAHIELARVPTCLFPFESWIVDPWKPECRRKWMETMNISLIWGRHNLGAKGGR